MHICFSSPLPNFFILRNFKSIEELYNKHPYTLYQDSAVSICHICFFSLFLSVHTHTHKILNFFFKPLERYLQTSWFFTLSTISLKYKNILLHNHSTIITFRISWEYYLTCSSFLKNLGHSLYGMALTLDGIVCWWVKYFGRTPAIW